MGVKMRVVGGLEPSISKRLFKWSDDDAGV